MHVLCIAGARPNFMKIKPVMAALMGQGIEASLVHTGQHYDQAMDRVFFDELEIPEPDFHLGVGSGTHAEQTARIMLAFEPILLRLRPDVVLVVGDVNSTIACALVAAKLGIPVAHVEAGLRSRDWSMPEEINRVVTDRLSAYLFAPSPDAVENLKAEGYAGDRVHLVGNVMVDTLLTMLDRATSRPILAALGLTYKKYCLVTLHRPSNVDDGIHLERLVEALAELSADLPVVFPAHPRTAARLKDVDLADQLVVTEPFGYLDFLALEAGARLVLTDSGGVQEETTVLGVPCLTIRTTTERPITVVEGTNRVVGTDPKTVLAEARVTLASEVAPRRPSLWDGHASRRIAEVFAAQVAVGD
jgi:UDP-N-acetylglucosamine 2-epimerase (non-hydrolysing)